MSLIKKIAKAIGLEIDGALNIPPLEWGDWTPESRIALKVVAAEINEMAEAARKLGQTERADTLGELAAGLSSEAEAET